MLGRPSTLFYRVTQHETKLYSMRNFLKIETNSLTKREFLFTNFDNAENKTNKKKHKYVSVSFGDLPAPSIRGENWRKMPVRIHVGFSYEHSCIF